jgi:hypothetical protein
MSVVGGIVAAAAVGLLAGWIRQRHTEGQVRSAQLGEAFSVAAKLRLARPGLRGRWREGVVCASGGSVLFRPRRPRPGARFDLSNARVYAERARRPAERWWFYGHTVLRCEAPRLGVFELAAGSNAELDLLREVVGARDDDNQGPAASGSDSPRPAR